MSEAESAPQIRNFVSESELEERRKRRQEEWEKVRQPDQPVDAPEEVYDHRSLYDRLQEQKDKKQMEFEETHKLKNMIRGLDDDEVQFLDLVDKTKEVIEKQRFQEESKEILEYRKAVASLEEEVADQKLQEIKKAVASFGNNTQQQVAQKKSRTALLVGVIKRKSSEKSEEKTDNKRPRLDSDSVVELPEQTDTVPTAAEDGKGPVPVSPVAKCIGILPGLGVYSDSSSDSEETSGSDIEFPSGKFDLLGRPRGLVQNHASQAGANTCTR